MSDERPRETLLSGVAILDGVLGSHGFVFQYRGDGRSSGGTYAWGEYVCGDRRLELHFRHSLGLVKYWLGKLAVSHEAYMTALGVRRQAAFPSVSKDPLEAFGHLAHDLERFGDDFLRGQGRVLAAAADAEAREVEARTKAATALSTGAHDKIEEAREAFKDGKWDEVVRLLGTSSRAGQLPEGDKRRLEIAKRRLKGAPR